MEPGLKLAITLRYLATGASYRDLAFAFRVAHNTISLFIPEVCQAIFEEYQAEMWNTPQTPDEWRPVAEGSETSGTSRTPGGAIDGKHIAITKPGKTGSLYYNFKGFFSIVMLAVVDANYKFMRAPGSSSDAGIFNRSRLEPALRLGILGLPPPEPLPNDDRDMPFFMIGDDAFPLRTYMMKPYSHRYQTIPRAHLQLQVVAGPACCGERVRHPGPPLQMPADHHPTQPRNVVKVAKACMTLHNIMRTRYPRPAEPGPRPGSDQVQLVPGAWRDDAVMRDVEAEGRGPRTTQAGKEQRAYFKKYFMSPAGSVPWQHVAIQQ